MLNRKNLTHLTGVLILSVLLVAGLVGSAAAATTKDQLNTDANAAVKMLLQTNPAAAQIATRAKAILIFPSIVRAGFVFGGAYGEGVLRQGTTIDGYYNTISASWGLQIGGQEFGYVVFLMNDKALKYVHESHGWEVGVGPTVVVVNEGVAKNLSSTTLQDDAYAFIFNQQGLMASLSLEGTKISRIQNP